jgi:branched-chain amino acid transport system ATP-binding protein
MGGGAPPPGGAGGTPDAGPDARRGSLQAGPAPDATAGAARAASGIDASARLRAHSVCVSFEGLVALSSVTLELEPGEILGLIGPNGAGKTTLVNVLTGFQAPDAGAVTLGAASLTRRPPHDFALAGVARTFQGGRLFRGLSVLENVEAAAVAAGSGRKDAAATAAEMLDWLGLAGREDLQAGALPYADERRLGIARALALRPRFLLLDEPAAGMSEQEADDLVVLVAQMPARFGAGVLLIEHNMDVITAVCQRVHVLDGGTTIAEGDPWEVLDSAAVVDAYLGRALR